MENKFLLKNPIKINGTEVSELAYDFESVSAEAYCEASNYAQKKSVGSIKIAETDGAFHLMIAFQAIRALNPSIDISDLERTKGSDLVAMARAGRNFTLGREE